MQRFDLLAARGESAVEHRYHCIERRSDLVQCSDVFRVPFVATPALENLEAGPQPVRKRRIFQHPGVVAAPMASLVVKQAFDLDPYIAVGPFRPGEVEGVAKRVHGRLGIG